MPFAPYQSAPEGSIDQACKRLPESGRIGWRMITGGHANAIRLKLFTQGLGWRLRRRKVEFVLREWYGRTGNNIQQLLVAIAHAEYFRGFFCVSEAMIAASPLKGIMDPFVVDFSGDQQPPDTRFRSDFFHYTELSFDPRDSRRFSFLDWPYCKWRLPRRNSILGRRYMEAHAHRIAQTFLVPHLNQALKSGESNRFSASDLVIHLRSGDVGDLSNRLYMTNPLCFYQQLARHYQRALIVTEPELNHPLARQVAALFGKHEIIAQDVASDFAALCHASHLASSGVGSFVIAAALLSTSLQTLHFSDLYLHEHLNPPMLAPGGARLISYPLPGFRNAWMSTANRHELLTAYQPT
ncbi:MAG: hypothetical protein ACKOZT_13940 [Cyanobium sp.]